MRRGVLFLVCLFWPNWALGEEILRGYAPFSWVELFKRFNPLILDHWEKEVFQFISSLGVLKGYYAWLSLGLLGLLLVHYFLFGPRRFSSRGRKIHYYSALTRFIHWGAAIFMSLLVFTGLGLIFAKELGGGYLVTNLRVFHLGSAFVFLGFGVLLFLIMVKDMFPAPYDLKWFFVLGGYLSKKKARVPAGKFNAGQKIWFWVSTLGGGAMFWTGYKLYLFTAPTVELRSNLILHQYLGLPLLALFLVHLYMALFAVKGALRSMISGYKHEEEVKILHPKYYEKLNLD